MIMIKLTGGLGNQLFQYTEGKALAIKNSTKLFLDITWYKGRLNRKYMLDSFAISASKASKFEIIRTKIFDKKNYIESDKRYDWLSGGYLIGIGDIIKREFILKNRLSTINESILSNIKSENSISIHLRGGDYVRGGKSGFHGVCPPEYYSKAIEYIKDRVASPHFFIFTDDIPWANAHIKFPEPHTFVSNKENPPQEELALMSACKHNIIANSTFSWWGAWLNTNKNKIVISPKKWFNNQSVNIDDLIPKSWIKI